MGHGPIMVRVGFIINNCKRSSPFLAVLSTGLGGNRRPFVIGKIVLSARFSSSLWPLFYFLISPTEIVSFHSGFLHKPPSSVLISDVYKFCVFRVVSFPSKSNSKSPNLSGYTTFAFFTFVTFCFSIQHYSNFIFNVLVFWQKNSSSYRNEPCKFQSILVYLLPRIGRISPRIFCLSRHYYYYNNYY